MYEKGGVLYKQWYRLLALRDSNPECPEINKALSVFQIKLEEYITDWDKTDPRIQWMFGSLK